MSRSRPFSRFEVLVAGRFLLSRRSDRFVSLISALTMGGIALGVAALIVVTSVMNGFSTEIISKLLGVNGNFDAYPIEARFTDYDQAAAEISAVPGVVAVIPYAEGQALASGPKSRSRGVLVRGLSADGIAKLPMLDKGLLEGDWAGWDGSNGIAIGQRLAKELKVGLGDPVTLLSPNGQETPTGKTPQVRSFKVVAIFSLGMSEFDGFYVYLPLRAAQDYFNLFDRQLKPGAEPPPADADLEVKEAAYDRFYRATALEIFITDPYAIAPMREAISAALSRPLVLSDWQQQHDMFFEALSSQGSVLFVILSLIVFVAAFNIISSLIMLVKDKGPDIAIMRSMGATRAAIMRIFALAGVAIGVSGTLVGLVVGLVLAANAEPIRAFISATLGVSIFPAELFYLSSLPSRTDMGQVLLITAIALGLSFLATLYPAWRAAQYDPVEVLRYE